MDEELKRLIKRRALKCGCDLDGTIIRYGGKLYYVNFTTDEVVLQNERKGERKICY